jgi:hypothetical protein
MDLPLPQFSPQLLTALQQSRNIVVFSGAGISAESGVATPHGSHRESALLPEISYQPRIG